MNKLVADHGNKTHYNKLGKDVKKYLKIIGEINHTEQKRILEFFLPSLGVMAIFF